MDNPSDFAKANIESDITFALTSLDLILLFINRILRAYTHAYLPTHNNSDAITHKDTKSQSLSSLMSEINKLSDSIEYALQSEELKTP